jgi:CpeT protein
MPLRPLRPFALLLTLGACAPATDTDERGTRRSSPDVDDPVDAVTEVAGLLSGRFDSSAQAARDPQYFAVQLHACPVDLPALGDHVVYVEQAMLSAVDAPYRQRLYVVTAEEDRVVSAVLELDAPEQVIGVCDFSAADRNRVLAARTATPLEGCAVVLEEDGDGWSGGTVDDACANDYAGATWASTEVRLTPTAIESWDRGYDDAGTQVWGATAGGYVFDRIE